MGSSVSVTETVEMKVERWRNRIKECRKMHEEMKDWEGRQSLEVVIQSYQKMIERELRERQWIVWCHAIVSATRLGASGNSGGSPAV